MKRVFDLCLASMLLLGGVIPLVCVAIAVRFTSWGPVLYWSERVGKNNRLFHMPKFRTMRIDTPEVASHLLSDPDAWLTPIGNLLRRTSLDELPQLWSIFRGHMTFVGPRPALHNQHDLVALRTQFGVHTLLPGLTGWAQINGRDELPISEKVALDTHYLENKSFWLDIKIFALTFLHVVQRKGTNVPVGIRGDGQGKAVPAEAFLASAVALFEQQQIDRSISDYDRAIEMVDDNAVTYNNRAAAWTAKGEFEKALDDYNRALALDPDFTTAFHNRGMIWAEMGDREKANNDFAQVVARIPEDITSPDGLVKYLTSGREESWRDDNGAVLVAGCDENMLGWKRLGPLAEEHDEKHDKERRFRRTI